MEQPRRRQQVTPVIILNKEKIEKLAQHNKLHHHDTGLNPTEKKRGREPRDTHSSRDEQDTAKKQKIEVEDTHSDPDSSAEEFDILLETKSPTKKPQMVEIVSNKTRIEKVSECLVRSVTIITPFRFYSVEYAKSLKVYRYDKKKPGFGQSTQKLQKLNNQAICSMSQLFSLFRTTTHLKFYILFSRSCLYFCWSESSRAPTLCIFTENQHLKRQLSEWRINFTSHWDSLDPEMVTLTGMHVARYWNRFINQVVEKDMAVEVVSNQRFRGCYEASPVVAFNGPENSRAYDYIRETEKPTKLQGVLDLDSRPTLYNAKIEGYFMRENLEDLCKEIEKRTTKFEISMEAIRQTENFKDMLYGDKKSNE